MIKNLTVFVLLIALYITYADDMLTNKQLYVQTHGQDYTDIKNSRNECKDTKICWVYSTKEKIDMKIISVVYTIFPFIKYKPEEII